MRAYDYWDGYTSAQIELMMIDQPITVYPRDKDKPRKHTREEIERIREAWEKKHGESGRMGEHVSLGEFLSGGSEIDKR